MSERNSWERRHMRAPGEAIIDAVSVGAVFILIGLVFVLALPNNLFDKIIAFFNNITTRQVSGISNLQLPAPANPGMHTVFYTAVFQFSLGLALLQILILALRIGFGSPIRRITGTVASLIFWTGASYLEYTYLIPLATSTHPIDMWFTFWAAILVVLGLSILARGIILLARR